MKQCAYSLSLLNKGSIDLGQKYKTDKLKIFQEIVSEINFPPSCLDHLFLLQKLKDEFGGKREVSLKDTAVYTYSPSKH